MHSPEKRRRQDALAVFSTLAIVASVQGAVAQPAPFVDLTAQQPDAAGQFSIVADRAPAKVGPYAVTTDLFRAASCKLADSCNPYVPLLWKLSGEGAGAILMNLTNEIPDDAVNFHTHGLVVAVNSATAGKIGDNVFVQVCNAATPQCGMSDHGVDPNTLQDPRIAGRAQYQFDFGSTLKAGLNWFHAHIHMQAQRQVAGGMSGVIAIGDICADLKGSVADETFNFLCAGASPTINVDHVQERFLALRDMQLVNVRSGPPLMADRATPIKAGFCGDLSKWNSEKLGECVGMQINDDAAAGGPNNCEIPGASGDCRWVFTINGAQYPSIAFHADASLPNDPIHEPSATQVWRIVNQSSDITYNLIILKEGLPDRPSQIVNGKFLDLVKEVCGEGAPIPAPDPNNPPNCMPFVVLNLDGAPAISAMKPNVNNAQYRLVLMPGARAEILVANPGFSTSTKYRLEQIGLSTGGDFWPPVALAELNFDAGQGSKLKFDVTPMRFVARMAARRAPAPAKDVPTECRNRPTVRVSDADRDVIVGFQVTPNDFRLATMKGGLENIALDATDTDMILKFSGGTSLMQPFEVFGKSMAQASGGALIVAPSLCVEVDDTGNAPPVTFHLVNFSPEIHNFHIHQQKFTISQITAPIDADKKPFLDGFFAGPGKTALHDTVPIPRADPDAKKWGMADISMSFDKPEQIGTFVYHCHILEHEDGGMMASIKGY